MLTIIHLSADILFKTKYCMIGSYYQCNIFHLVFNNYNNNSYFDNSMLENEIHAFTNKYEI